MQKLLFAIAASEEAHVVHPQEQQAVRVRGLPFLSQDQKRSGGAL